MSLRDDLATSGAAVVEEAQGGFRVTPPSIASLGRAVAVVRAWKLPLRVRGSGDAPVNAPPRGVLLDIGTLDRIASVDGQTAIARVEAGCSIAALEQAARRAGCTLGPLLPSARAGSIGAWLAGPTRGERGIPGARRETAALCVAAVLADGRIAESRAAPRSATGPDLDHLALGGSGRLCVVAAAWIRLFPLAPALAGSWTCRDLETAVAGLERLCHERLAPARARVLAGADSTRLAAAWEGPETAPLDRDRAGGVLAAMGCSADGDQGANVWVREHVAGHPVEVDAKWAALRGWSQQGGDPGRRAARGRRVRHAGAAGSAGRRGVRRTGARGGRPRHRPAADARPRPGLGRDGRGRSVAPADRGARRRGGARAMTLAAVRRAQELCEFCPKMCRFACPVSEATGREALTPWGKVSLAALVGRQPDAAAALAFAGCTGCHRCAVYCAHDNDVPAILYAARATAVRAGVAPQAWTGLPARFSAQGHGETQDLAAVFAGLRTGHGDALLFPGCDALASGGAEARDALFVAKALGAPLGLVPEGALCCGLKLQEAGHPELSAAHASRVRGLLGRSKPVHLVFLAPSCAQSVAEHWDLPEGSSVEHVTSYLARALAALPERSRPPPLPETFVWHDPCALARGLRELTAPRALLAAAVDDFREPPRSGVDTSCCGAGGLLPRTLPEVAAKLADERKAELGGPCATSSPACAAALDATELVSILARWLGTPSGDTLRGHPPGTP